MLYAPVCVVTLNRIEHLKRLIESLKKNSIAIYTELFVSVDYPPDANYIKGYEKVKDYLKGNIEGFSKVNIFYQDHNLGPFDNWEYVITKAREKYDYWIGTEDDNEFSENFLEYMDLMLTKYQNDKKTYAICGCIPDEIRIQRGNYGFCKCFSPYGFGIWADRYDKMCNSITTVLLDKNNQKIRNMIHFFRTSPVSCCQYINRILTDDNPIDWNDDGTVRPIDVTQAIYMNFVDLRCVFPRISKARTRGNDGSGLHMPKIEDEKLVDLDPKNYFIPSKEICEMPVFWDNTSKIEKCKAICRYFIFLMFGKNIAVRITHRHKKSTNMQGLK